MTDVKQANVRTSTWKKNCPENSDACEILKERIDQLQRNKLVIQRAEELARLGYFIFDIHKDKTTFLSEGLKKIASSLSDGNGEISYISLLARVHPEDMKRVEFATRSSIDEGLPLDVEFRAMTMNGDIQHLWLTDDSIEDPVSNEPLRIGIVQDITERREGEEQLRKQAALRHAVTKNAVDGIVTFSASGNILEFNPAAENIFRLSSNKAIGKPFVRLLFHPEDWSNISSAVDLDNKLSVVSRHYDRIEARCVGSDGRLFNVETTITPISVNGKKYYSAQIRDVTERIGNERELRDAKEGAESANQAKSQFLTQMSHEIRTPLNGVLGVMSVLEDTELTSEQTNLVELAKSSGEALLALVNDILDLSKAEATQVELNFGIVNLEELVRSAAEVFTCFAEESNNDLVVEIGECSGKHFVSDGPRISQVLRNLISNAVKNTENGRVTIQSSMVQSPEDEKHTRLRLEVTDTGCGVADSLKDELFSEFIHSTSPIRNNQRNTGLGLAISKMLVEALDGEIDFSSKEGAGSSFWFSIPVNLQQEFADQSIDVESVGNASIQCTQNEFEDSGTLNGNVLLAEDSMTNAIVVRSILEMRGVDVTHVMNGKDALRLLKDKEFDVILMDISMPVLDGLSAIKLIQKMPGKTKSIPIIALTAHAMRGDEERYLKAGAIAYLPKPFRKEELLELVTNCMEVGKMKQEAFSKPPLFCSISFERVWADMSDDQVDYVVSAFIQETRARFELCSSLVADKKWEQLAIEAHALKSSSRNVGLLSLGELANDLESASTKSNNHDIASSFKSSQEIVEASIDSLRVYLSKREVKRFVSERSSN